MKILEIDGLSVTISVEILKEDSIMAYKIGDACISCGSCAAQCPAEAISEGDGKYVIDADKCVDCGACASQCPVEAIEQ